jgi:hypothetical protein
MMDAVRVGHLLPLLRSCELHASSFLAVLCAWASSVFDTEVIQK